MRAAVAALVWVSLLVLTSGCPSADPCELEGRACPIVCEGTGSSCAEGELCTDGFCAQPPPTPTAYSACALDADCPRGDYCDLGACTHDCISDRDCSDGQVCSNRGRCAEPELVAEPPAIQATSTEPGAARLAVSTSELRFERGQLSQQLTLTNEGGQPLTFRALSSRPWITLDPATGEISGQAITVTATIDPSLVGAEETAHLRFNSTGGAADVDVFLPRNLSGLYAGDVRFTAPYPFAVSSLHLSFTEGEAGALTGLVDPDRSLLYPHRAELTGTATGNDVTLQFALVGLPGSTLNPSFHTPVRRTVTLSGTVTGAGIIEGTMSEQLEGAVAETPLSFTGTFRLERVGQALTDTPAAQPQYEAPVVASPFTGAAYEACLNDCPVVGGCDDDLEAGTTYLTRAADFYSQFAEAAGQTGSPFDEVAANCSTTGCLNAAHLRCAQYRFSRAVLAAPQGGGSAETGLLDALATLGDYSMLFGGNEVVRAVEAWETQTLSAEVGVWDEAIGFFKVARHTTDGSSQQAALDPYFAKLLFEGIKDTTFSGSSTLLTQTGPRGEREHLRRILNPVVLALHAGVEKTDRQFRLGQLAQARSTTTRTSLETFLDLAVMAHLYQRSGAEAAEAPEFASALTHFAALSRRFDDLNMGRNPAGFLPTYVPFLLDTRLAGTNFSQIYDSAGVAHGKASSLESEARSESRAFESSSLSLGQQVNAQVSALKTQLIDICGSELLSTCGTTTGSLFSGIKDVQTSILRMEQAHLAISNLTEEVKIEESRAAQVAGVHRAQAKLVLANGQRLNAIAEQEHLAQQAASIYSGFGSVVGAIAGAATNPGGVITAFTSAVAGHISAEAQQRAEQSRNRITTLQSAQVDLNSASIEIINSEAQIKTRMLQSATLALDLEIARINTEQAMSNVLAQRERAGRLVEEQRRLLQASADSLRASLAFRIFAGQKTVAAQTAFRDLLRWAYLATRAYEYERNVSYAYASELWSARDSAAVRSYLDTMYLASRENEWGTPQSNVEVISVRDHLLEMGSPVTDMITGYTYSPRERFRRFVADPANRDVNGNLRITFTTYRPENPVFSRNVCNDQIKTVRMNLIGDNLGAGVTTAFVRLVHGGSSYQKSCEGDHPYVGYDLSSLDNKPRVARIQAGVNAPNNAGGFPANTDLAARALLSGPWELVIDLQGETANANLDVSGLDDIELIIDHEAVTLQ